MPKCTFVLNKRVVGIDTDTGTVIVYAPQKSSLSALTDEEQKQVLKGLGEMGTKGGVWVASKDKKID
jgi:hypothetical protein